MKDLMISKLADVYGALLTDKQQKMLREYYDLDYSLSEIAENCLISRQAVHSAIKQACETLLQYEKTVRLFERMTGIGETLLETQLLLEENRTPEASERIQKIVEDIRSKYGIIQQFK